MKKNWLVLAILVFIVAIVHGQTSTIVDNPSYFTIEYEGGDTVCIGKDNIGFISVKSDRVLVMSVERQYKLASLSYIDFGYASACALRDYLAVISFRAYTEVYSYDGGNLDTVSYYQGANLQYQVVYGYTDAVVTSKTIVTQ